MVDGKQYIAFVAGTGRNPHVVGANNANVDNAPNSFVFEINGTALCPCLRRFRRSRVVRDARLRSPLRSCIAKPVVSKNSIRQSLLLVR